MKVVLADLWKIDVDHSLESNCFVDSPEQLKEATNTTYVLAQTKEHLEWGIVKNASPYMPYSFVTNDNLVLGGKIYFDLENYSFYQKIVSLIGAEKVKGVLRYRRTIKGIEDLPLFIGDLYVLMSLFGKPVDIQVKQTRKSDIPVHTICLIQFGGGRLAHIECTVSNQERIEFEWSGVNTIIEFDSEQMKPIQPSQDTLLAMTYSIDSILINAHDVTDSLIVELKHIKDLVYGGDPA